MDCDRVKAELDWIIRSAVHARARLNNGDSTGVEDALCFAEKAIAAICGELKGARQ